MVTVSMFVLCAAAESPQTVAAASPAVSRKPTRNDILSVRPRREIPNECTVSRPARPGCGDHWRGLLGPFDGHRTQTGRLSQIPDLREGRRSGWDLARQPLPRMRLRRAVPSLLV